MTQYSRSLTSSTFIRVLYVTFPKLLVQVFCLHRCYLNNLGIKIPYFSRIADPHSFWRNACQNLGSAYPRTNFVDIAVFRYMTICLCPSVTKRSQCDAFYIVQGQREATRISNALARISPTLVDTM